MRKIVPIKSGFSFDGTLTNQRIFFCVFRTRNPHRFSASRARVKIDPKIRSRDGILLRMKKLVGTLLLAPLLFACGPIDDFEKVDLGYGTLIGMDDEISGDSHMLKIGYGELRSLLSEGRSFILVVHNSISFCSCYADWHNDVLAPYIKRHNLLVYMIDYNAFEGEDDYGLDLISNHETLAIFNEGELKYQHTNEAQESDWVTKPEVFAEWMDARIEYPRMLTLDKETLDSLYAGEEAFTVLFTLSGCPDCTYMERNGLKDYFSTHQNTDYLYVVDTAQEGIRLYKNEEGDLIAGSDQEDATEDQKKAYEQWTQFKAEYGLSATSLEEPGFGEGYVPTIFHIAPQVGEESKAERIDAAGVFYNDTIDQSTGKVTSTYFSSARLEAAGDGYLTYLTDAELSVDKSIDGKTFDVPFGEMSSSEWREYVHEALSPYHDAYLGALLDWCIAY